MFQLLFQNLFNIHRQTRLLEIFSWSEEASKNYVESISFLMNEFNGESIEDLIQLCLKEADPFIIDSNKSHLEEFLREEFDNILKDIIESNNNEEMEN